MALHSSFTHVLNLARTIASDCPWRWTRVCQIVSYRIGQMSWNRKYSTARQHNKTSAVGSRIVYCCIKPCELSRFACSPAFRRIFRILLGAESTYLLLWWASVLFVISALSCWFIAVCLLFGNEKVSMAFIRFIIFAEEFDISYTSHFCYPLIN